MQAQIFGGFFPTDLRLLGIAYQKIEKHVEKLCYLMPYRFIK